MEAIDVRTEGTRTALRGEEAGPRIIGRYRLREEIASGGMATVHLARQIGDGGFARTVAIKRLHAQYARDPEFVAMFLDEARLAARITHPNVIPVIDVVHADAELFLVMEYVRGAPLSLLRTRARERGQAVPPAIAARILCDVLAGLHAAHEARDEYGEPMGLVHRDVSPQNVLVGTDGVARVFDFGIAKAAGRLQVTRRGQLKGKLSYMAPEQIQDEIVSRATDVYAASIVLWEALTGKRLFLGDDEQGTLNKVLSAVVPPPSDFAPCVSKELDEIVLRGLDREPSRRYSAAHEMVMALTRCCPLASSSEVGEWVASLAREEIAKTAKMVEAVERLRDADAESSPRGLVEEITGARAPARSTSRIIAADAEITASTLRRFDADADADADVTSAASQPSCDWNVSLSPYPRPRARFSARTVVLALTLVVGIAPATLGRWLVKNEPARPSLSLTSKVAVSSPHSSTATATAAEAAAHAHLGERPPAGK